MSLYTESNATVFCMHCGTSNSNQSRSKEYEYVMEFPSTHFNVLVYGLAGYGVEVRKKLQKVCKDNIFSLPEDIK